MTRDPLFRQIAERHVASETEHEFQCMINTLIGILSQQVHYSERLSTLLRRRLEARARNDFQTYEYCLEVGKEALAQVVLVEGERVAALTELGLYLEHRRPSSLRLAELILYLEPEDRDELLDLRELLRDKADEIDQLHALGGHLERRVHGTTTLFLASGLPAEDESEENLPWRESAPPESDPPIGFLRRGAGNLND